MERKSIEIGKKENVILDGKETWPISKIQNLVVGRY
jgi:hypothetical protein